MAKKSKKSEDKQVEVAVKKAVKSERKKLAKAVGAAEEAAARAERAAAKAAGRAKSAKKASKKVAKKAAGSPAVDTGESSESVAPEATPLQNVDQDAQLSEASAKVAGDPLGSAGASAPSPADDPHARLTRAQLVVLAGERGVPNRSRLTKAQLLEALRTR